MTFTPLQFTPLYKYRLWGGEKLKTELHKNYNESNIGESWEISDVKNDETVVALGDFKGQTLTQLITAYKGAFLGDKVYKQFGNAFPLLIKFIDAKTPLSIQVHPSNAIAKERHNAFGKNEMWYVMGADKDAELIVGFDKEITKDVYKNLISDGSILDVMHHETVAEGDTFYIPTGRVHAIGAGVLLAEIQQTSDVTYRIYDYNRVDVKTGKTRDLHNNLAIDVIDFKTHDSYKTTYKTVLNTSNKLVHSPYFTTNIIVVNGTLTKDYGSLDSFVIYMCVAGNAIITHNSKEYPLVKGQTLLLPAAINNVSINSNTIAKVLEVYM